MATVRNHKLIEWGPNPTCWRCHKVIDGTVVVGHIIDRVSGGTDQQLAPEHPLCSASSGGDVNRIPLEQRAEPGRFGPRPATSGPLSVSVFPPEGPSRSW